jgi:hypothetical protein
VTKTVTGFAILETRVKETVMVICLHTLAAIAVALPASGNNTSTSISQVYLRV